MAAPAACVGWRDVIRSVGSLGGGFVGWDGGVSAGRFILLTLNGVLGGGGIGGLEEVADGRFAAAAFAGAPLDAFF